MRVRPRTIRGRVLWLFGLAFVIVGGINYLGTTIPARNQHYLAFALDYAPGWVYGVAFCVVGALCFVTSYMGHGRDRIGYQIGALFSVGWAVVYICGWAFYGAPIRALGGSVVWFIYGALLITCARIPSVTSDDFRRAVE